MITTITLNASIDKAYYMKGTIENGTVMRVMECRNSAGGKGLNVARVAKLCGSDVKASGMVGGFNGAYLESMLSSDGIDHDFFHIAGETRSCINILDEGYGSTEYLEPGCGVTEEEVQEFLQQVFPQVIKDSHVVTISGSVPKGCGSDIYAHMVEEIKSQGKQVILDTSGQLLKEGIKAKPTMVKPNQDEIELLYDTKITSFDEVKKYAQAIHQEGIEYVVISLGGDGALLVCSEGMYQGKPPKVDVINTVGCGDSMVGAFAVALEKKMTPDQALKYAVAVASANACTPDTGRFDPAKADEILAGVTVTKL